MSPGATFERVYQGLKERLGSGRYAAGQQLEPAILSDELNASITPVRDALHRLVGEGLVETPRGDGFRTPMITEIRLRHLYRWNSALLELAARAPGQRAASEAREGEAGDALSRTEALFLDISARFGNPEHIAAIARLNHRLRPVRLVETGLLDRIDDELAAIIDQAVRGAAADLRRSIAHYHRRRERLAPDIVASLHRAGSP